MVANNNNSNQLTKFTNKSIIFSPIYWYGLFVRGVLLFFFYLNGTVKIKEDEGRRRGAKGRQATRGGAAAEGNGREMVSSKGLRGLIRGAEAARRFRQPHQGHQGAGLKKARAGAKRTSRPARRPPDLRG